MMLRLTARKTASFLLLTALLLGSTAVVAAEPLSNSSLSDTYITSGPPAPSCKTASAAQTSSGKSPCPASRRVDVPMINPAQDEVVRQTLSQQDSVHTVLLDNGTQGNPQQLQNLQSIIYGYSNPAAQGATTYTTYGNSTTGHVH